MKLFGRNNDESVAEEAVQSDHSSSEEPSAGMFSRLKKGLTKTGASLSKGLGTVLLGKREIDDELFDDLETQLLLADVGIDATRQVLDYLAEQVARDELLHADALLASLKVALTDLVRDVETPLAIGQQEGPFVILVVGVNGVGKTTTIGKLAKKLQADGQSVMLAAGDTFRAAAVEQLQEWGDRNQVPVIAQHTGADSASVIFDAVEAARSRGVDVLIADTAGRLHNKDHLMDELKKIVRVMQKLDAKAPHEVLLVLDGGTGQNAISQAQIFAEAVGVTGLAVTKLDGTAKGGILFALAKQLKIPVRFIGVGEQVDDLRPFIAKDFVNALIDDQI